MLNVYEEAKRPELQGLPEPERWKIITPCWRKVRRETWALGAGPWLAFLSLVVMNTFSTTSWGWIYRSIAFFILAGAALWLFWLVTRQLKRVQKRIFDQYLAEALKQQDRPQPPA